MPAFGDVPFLPALGDCPQLPGGERVSLATSHFRHSFKSVPNEWFQSFKSVPNDWVPYLTLTLL